MTARARRAARTEAAFWLAGLVLVALPTPTGEPWFSLCLFDRVGDWLGLSFCPGCGLGRSIALLARGDVAASFAMHPLGLPAVVLLVRHAVGLLRDARTARIISAS